MANEPDINEQYLIDDPVRLQEMAEEEIAAKAFNITIGQLREQRRSLGQLLTGPYAGCSPGFVRTMEQIKYLDKAFGSLNH